MFFFLFFLLVIISFGYLAIYTNEYLLLLNNVDRYRFEACQTFFENVKNELGNENNRFSNTWEESALKS